MIHPVYNLSMKNLLFADPQFLFLLGVFFVTYLISILQVLVKVAGANQKAVPSLYKIIRVLYFSVPPLNVSSALVS